MANISRKYTAFVNTNRPKRGRNVKGATIISGRVIRRKRRGIRE